MSEALLYLAAAWLLWAWFNLLAMAASAALGDSIMPRYDGFRIVIPAWLTTALTPRELEAIRQHEEGHRARMHPWRNLLALCVFRPATRFSLLAQELEADDFVRDPAAMASAIRKTSQNATDLYRAERLERRAARELLKGRQEAGDPAPGKGATTEEGAAR